MPGSNGSMDLGRYSAKRRYPSSWGICMGEIGWPSGCCGIFKQEKRKAIQLAIDEVKKELKAEIENDTELYKKLCEKADAVKGRMVEQDES